MSWWLQVILALVLLVVGGFLVQLLLQLRRTAAAVQALAESARKDLDLITADVHHLRARVDGLADLADRMPRIAHQPRPHGRHRHPRLRNVPEPAHPGLGGALLTGFKIALKFLRRPKKGAASEEAEP